MALEWLVVLLLGAATSIALVLADGGERLDSALYDLLSRAAPAKADPRILVVAIDDDSLREVGRWPWPRAVHAQVIDRLAAAGARAIAYDVLFLEPSSDARQDAALSAAVGRAGNVCLPLVVQMPGDNGGPFDLEAPAPPLARVARFGHVQMTYDADGIARRAIPAEANSNGVLPHLVGCALGAPVAGRWTLPTAAGGPLAHRPMLIPFARPGAYRTVSAGSVLRGEVPDAFFRGKYVLVGASASGLNDHHRTATSGRGSMPGVEVEANLLAAMLSGRLIHTAPPPLIIGVTLAAVLTLMLAVVVLPPRAALPLGFATLALAIAASALALLAGGLWLPPGPFVLTALVIFPLWGWRRLERVSQYMLEELQRFAHEPELLPRLAHRGLGGDVVARQIQLMDQTIEQARTLRHFAADTLRGLPDPTLVVSPEGAVLFANPSARRLAGDRKPDGTGAPALHNLADGWRRPSGEPLPLPPLTDIDARSTMEVQAPDGRPYLAALAPYRDSRGALAAWIIHLTDIGDLKAAAAQREQVVQLLSHDIRSPQSSIIALLDGAPRDAINPTLAERIQGYARRTLALAGNFVLLSRTGSPSLAFELLDLSDVVIEAVDEVWPQATCAGIRLATEGVDEERLVKGDRALLTRAVINLLDNALKYSPRGSTVCCRLEQQGGDILLSVADEGCGLTPEQQAALFVPFTRFGTRDQPYRDGAGLGLTLVWEVLQRHGGSVTVESAPAAGSTFVLRLPMVAEAPTAAPAS